MPNPQVSGFLINEPTDQKLHYSPAGIVNEITIIGDDFDTSVATFEISAEGLSFDRFAVTHRESQKILGCFRARGSMYPVSVILYLQVYNGVGVALSPQIPVSL